MAYQAWGACRSCAVHLSQFERLSTITSRAHKAAMQPVRADYKVSTCKYHILHSAPHVQEGGYRNIAEFRRRGARYTGSYKVKSWSSISRLLTSYCELRVVGLDCHEQDPYDVDVVGKRFGIQIQKLLNGEPVICANTNRELPSLRPPSTLLVDVSIKVLSSSRTSVTWPRIDFRLHLSSNCAKSF